MALLRVVDIEKIKPSFPVIGTVFTGSPKGTSKRRNFQGGDDLGDVFRIALSDSLVHQASPVAGFPNMKEYLESRIREKYNTPSEAPYITVKSLSIRFPYEAQRDYLSVANEEWMSSARSGNTCTRRCDGTTCSLHIDKAQSKALSDSSGKNKMVLSKEPIPCAAGPDDDACPAGCSSIVRLSFFISDIGYPTGLFRFNPTGIINQREILGLMMPYQDMDVRNLLFRLTREETSFNVPAKDGSTVAKKYFKTQIALDPAYSAAYQKSRDALLGASIGSQPLLITDDGDSADEVYNGDVVLTPAIAPAEELKGPLAMLEGMLERAGGDDSKVEAAKTWALNEAQVKAGMDVLNVDQLTYQNKVNELVAAKSSNKSVSAIA